MSKDKNTTQQSNAGIGRWLRVGYLTFTMLGPAITTVLERRRTLAEAQKLKAEKAQELVAVPAGVKPALSDSLLELPYAQMLVRRSEELTSDLRDRGSRLSQNVAEHGGKVSRDLVDRSNDLLGRGGQASQDVLKQSEKAIKKLRKRSEKAAQGLGKQSEKAARRLSKQTQKASQKLTQQGEKITQRLVKNSQQFTQDLAERNGRAWTIVGFTVGLISASAIAFVFISRRIRSNQEEVEEQHILLSPNGYQKSSNGNGAVPVEVEQNGAQPYTSGDLLQSEVEIYTIPADAALVGVVSTKSYYPVETPLATLQEQDGAGDIVYFSSEEEARAQGFSAANEDSQSSEN